MNKFCKISAVALIVGCGIGLVGCNEEPPKDGKSAYELAVENGFDGTLEEWLESLKGNDGYTPTISVSADGYWIINGSKTNITAVGINGEDGETGQNGTSILSGTANPLITQGKNGDLYINTTTFDVFEKKNDYWIFVSNIKGENGKEIEIQFDEGTKTLQWRYVNTTNPQQWQPLTTISDGINGTLWDIGTINPVDIDGNNGDFYLNTTNYSLWYKNNDTWSLLTIIKGEDGSTPEIEIGNDNYWYINGKNTGVIATGISGTDGREIELTEVNGTIKWRYKTTDNSETWQELITLTNGQDGDDGTKWITGTDNVLDTIEANNGDFYLNTETYEIFKKINDTWDSLGVIKGTDGVTPNIEIRGEIWYINGSTTNIRATGTKWFYGESFEDINGQIAGDFFLEESTSILYRYNSANGWEEIGCLKGESAPTVEEVNVEYRYDNEGNLNVVFVFTMSDGSEIVSSESILPQRVEEMSLVNETKLQAGQHSNLQINVKYENGTSETIDVSEDMFVDNDTYSPVDFNTIGTYEVRINYRNKFIVETIEVYNSYSITGIDNISTIEIYDNNKAIIVDISGNRTEETFDYIIKNDNVISISLSENNIACLQLNSNNTAGYYVPTGAHLSKYDCEENGNTYYLYANNIVVITNNGSSTTSIYNKVTDSELTYYEINGSIFVDGESQNFIIPE